MKHLLLPLLLFAAITVFPQKKKLSKPIPAYADSLFNAGNFKDAITAYGSLVKGTATANDARTWYRLGAAWFNVGDFSKALPAFKHAWSINSKQPGLRLAMARTYSMLSDNDKCIAMLDSTIATGFGNFRLLDTDPGLENVRKDPRFAVIHERAFDIAYPCHKLLEAKQFDFWLGEWDVAPTSNPGFNVGLSKITRAAEGCVILENWKSLAGPHEGMSINYYDAFNKEWRQRWAGSGQDVQDFNEGKYENNYMRFRFVGRNPDGSPFEGRLTFTNIEEGKVRQHSERTDDKGKSWQTIYDFTYTRRAEGAKP